MPIEEKFITTWEALNQELRRDAFDPAISRFRYRDVFRGHADARNYHIMSSLLELEHRLDKVRDIEKYILRSFVKYAHTEATASSTSLWHWMSLAQHHGLPTRLIDWTYSPYVALHFAVGALPDTSTDAVLWRVSFYKVHETLPKPLKTELTSEGFNLFSVENLDNVAQTLPEFDRLSRDTFALFFEPPSLDQRIVNQYALFSVMSDPTITFDSWLEQLPDTYTRIRIPGALKWEIRDRLDSFNITERVLFPGLDGLSIWLKRWYSPSRISRSEEFEGEL